MKTFIKSAFALAIMALTITGCEDVPAPFDTSYNDNSSTGGATDVKPQGEGTKDAPYNVAKVLEIIKAGEQTSSEVYLKGVITNIKDINTEQYGNATFSISDTKDGKKTFLIYRTYGLNGQKFKTGHEIAVGDTVTMLAQLIIFNGTPETKQGAKIISINGKGEAGGKDTPTAEPTGEGTQASPYNVAKALAVTKALPKDGKTEDVYVTGIIVGTPSVDTGTYGNATYDISDDGKAAATFKIFRGYAFNGDKFKPGQTLKAGDKVVVCGKLLNYFGNTPEMAQGNKLISINGKAKFDNRGDTPNDNPSDTPTGLTIDGTTVTAVNSNATAGTTTATIDLSTLKLEKGTEVTSVKLSDGSTITFAGGTNTNSKPVFYPATKGVRVYANNTIAFDCKGNIAKIVFKCDAYNGTNYVGNKTATITYDGNKATYTNKHAENKGGVQLRVQSITVTYAK